MRRCARLSVRRPAAALSKRPARTYASLSTLDAAPLARASLSTAVPAPPPPQQQPTPRLAHAAPLTALHTARALLPRVLAPDAPELAFWTRALDGAAARLEEGGGALDIAVYAVGGGDAGAVVEALLVDPFGAEGDAAAVEARWAGREDAGRLEIRSGPAPLETASDAVHVTSNFFSTLPVAARIVELRPTSASLHALYAADIPLLLLDPLTTPLPRDPTEPLLPFALPPHTLVLVSSASPTSAASAAVEHLARALALPPTNVLLLDPARARGAAHALRGAPPSALRVQRYADDALGSGLSALRAALAARATPDPRARTAGALVQAALGTARAELARAEGELDAGAQVAQALQALADEARAEAHLLLRGAPSSAAAGAAAPDVIDAALSAADAIVRPAVHGLWFASGPQPVRSGWAARLLLRPPRVRLAGLGGADDVGWAVDGAVRNAWTAGIERALLPAYAPLAPLQARLNAQARAQLAALPAGLASPVLLNALAQRAHAPSQGIEALALLAPLAERLQRLSAGPTQALARAAQNAAARVLGSAAGGVGVAGGTLAWAHGADAVLGAPVAADVGPAVGAGLLVFLGGTRWALGRWAKARAAWLDDWERVREAGARELRERFAGAVEESVLGGVAEAKVGVDDVVEERRGRVAGLLAEVRRAERTGAAVGAAAAEGPAA